jgi:hypothetical protein
LRETHEDLTDIRKGLSKIANMGSRIADGSFNQGVDDLRHLVWESIWLTLELCKPSLTHLFDRSFNRSFNHSKSVGKANGPASKKGEGQKKK